MKAAHNPTDWKAHVARYRGEGVGNGVRALLLVMADEMNGQRRVSVPRIRLAAMLNVSEKQIYRRIRAAKNAGLLDTVVRGHNGMTAVYQGLFAVSSGTSRGSIPRTPTGNPKKYPYSASSGTPVGPTSSKSNHSDTPGSQPSARRGEPRAQQREDEQPREQAPVASLLRSWSESLPQAEPNVQSQATVVTPVTQLQTMKHPWLGSVLTGAVCTECKGWLHPALAAAGETRHATCGETQLQAETP